MLGYTIWNFGKPPGKHLWKSTILEKLQFFIPDFIEMWNEELQLF